MKQLLSQKYRAHLFLILISVFYFFFYQFFLNISRPGLFTPEGYYGWWDQSRYVLMAREIANGNLQHYDYGLGYPFLGAPFVNIVPYDPFLIPNLILWIAIVILFYEICMFVFKKNFVALITSFLFIFTTNIIQYIVIPWNSTVVLFSNLLILYLGLHKKRTFLRTFLMSFLLVWIFSARYVDIIFSAIISIAYFLPLLYRKDYKQIFFGVAVILIGVSLVFTTHKIYFGDFLKTPYAFHLDHKGKISDQDIRRYRIKNIPESLKGVLFGKRTEAYFFPPIISTSFYFLFSPIGFILGLFTKKRFFYAVTGTGMLLAFLFYASFPHFSEAGLRVGALHYVKAWFPIIVIYVMQFLVEVYPLY